ncbi:hypothetical protein PGN04_26830 [Klebsiella quasipneumoniae subsp. quasipneumoniae]|uniref:hypothetical protein n=1 Tax=Klebsiella quasipneumoniae TaxID=1463165 RepID=UPI0022F0D38C|nr:hypothetical protein [Klebsiella quasipneumoniae]MDA5091458.1 hypothetical protein [Klebsiella quasipneumoniae subsp. quasipneumoniae]
MTTDITKLALLVSQAKASVFTLKYISQFEPDDIDSDDVDLRFEVDGRDTGTNVSIVDECGQAVKVIGALVEALEKAQQRIAELESSGVAPGILRCTECSFVQTKNIISVTADTITTVESESEPCPNGCGQLQPVTWKALTIHLMFTTKQGLSDLLAAKNRIAELEREQEHLRPVGVMSEKAFHRLENSECRFIALWPRPGIFLPRKRPEDGVIVYARTAAAAGIKMEAE